MTSDDLITVAVQAARAAGREIVDRLGREREVRSKGWRDLVTDGDLAAQDVLVRAIRSHFPDHGILSEELPAPAEQREITWVLDPIDGTSNYAHAFPVFSVSVGVVDREGLRCGVVYDPLRDHMFSAERGAGARLNGQPLRVSSIEDAAAALVGFDSAREPNLRAEVMRRLLAYSPHVHTFRCIGSAALGLCYVAKGWIEAYFHAALAPWDSAAAVLIVREAGGLVTDLEGRPWVFAEPTCLASNGRVHEALLHLGASVAGA
jgi:myo-inositol-1(or 4)-monophosphatase